MASMSNVRQPAPAAPPHGAADPLWAGRDALSRHAWPEAFEQLSAADRAGGLGAARAVAIGSATADPDLTAYSQTNLGALKIAMGNTTDGFALMEEASVAAVNGDLSPFTSGVTACRMIGACRDLTDYRRANEWIEATEKYCDRNSLEGFPGVCRIHRAEVVAVGGAWERAEAELE